MPLKCHVSDFLNSASAFQTQITQPGRRGSKVRLDRTKRSSKIFGNPQHSFAKWTKHIDGSAILLFR